MFPTHSRAGSLSSEGAAESHLIGRCHYLDKDQTGNAENSEEKRLTGSLARLSHQIGKRIYLKPVVIAAVRSQCQRNRIKGAGQKIHLAFEDGGGQKALLRKCCWGTGRRRASDLIHCRTDSFPVSTTPRRRNVFRGKDVCKKRCYDVWELLQDLRGRLGAEVKQN